MWARHFTRVAVLGAAFAFATVLTACEPQTTPSADGTQLATGGAGAHSPDAQGGEAAALPDDPEALFAYAMARLESDPDGAAVAFEGAALQGHGPAAYQMARQQDDLQVAVGWYAMAAGEGVVEAQYALGQAYLYGQGTAREPAWGVSWFERAARRDFAPAQYALGLALQSGVLGGAQPEEALVWFLVAKGNGFDGAELAATLLEARLSETNVNTARERAAAWQEGPTGDGDARADTRFAQYALSRLGFDAGLADGIEGERTRQAVSDFRVRENLGPGGLNARTLDLLRDKLAALGR